MIKMIFKKIWNQRRGNSWLIIESFIVFLLFCLLLDFLVVYISFSFDYPRGYSIDKVYSLKLDRDNNIKTDESTHESIRKIVQKIDNHAAIEAVTVYFGVEHFGSDARLLLKKDSIDWNLQFFSTDEHYFDVFKVQVEQDGGIFPWKIEDGISKIIFTQRASDIFFGNKNPIGQSIQTESDSTYRISGLIKKTKHRDGATGTYCYTTLPENYKYSLRTSIAFRIKDGISYEQFDNMQMDDFKKLLSTGAIYPDSVLSLKQLRKDGIYNDGTLILSVILAAGLLFFIFNLFVGMFATFHFRITKRKGELGLKLSLGASRRILMKELIAEGILILTLAAIPAIIIVANLYYLEVGWMTNMPITLLRVFACILSTYMILALMVSLGTWLPARRVMKIEPAIALKEE